MNDSKISVRYAKALFLTAKDAGILVEVSKDMTLFEASLETERFRDILESPVIKTSQKIQLVKNVFEKSIQTLSMDFLILVLRNKRETYMPGIIRYYSRLFKEEQGVKSAELIVPSRISDQHRKKFMELLKKVYSSEIDMKDKIDPDLIGGFILKVEDEQFDASVSTSLSRIKKNLLETTIEK